MKSASAPQASQQATWPILRAEALRLASVFDARKEDSHDIIDAATLLPQMVDVLDVLSAAVSNAQASQPPQGAEADRIVRMVLEDMDTCIGECGPGWESKELSTETVEALNAYGDGIIMQRLAAPPQGASSLLPENATEPMQKAMQRAVLLRKSMNDVWRAALSELPAASTPAPQEPAEPIGVEAVAEVKLNKHGFPYLDWLIEGGISALPEGVVLVVSHQPITDDEGRGEVYAAPVPVSPSDRSEG